MNAFPQIQQITARPIQRPVYVSTAVTLRSFAAWMRANEPAVTRYYGELARQADYDGDFDEGANYSDFCGCQYDVARAASRNPADVCFECGCPAVHITTLLGREVGLCADCK